MDIENLSASERILLAQQLWESVAEKSAEIPVTPAQAALLDARLKAFVSDEIPGDTWEVVKRRVLGA